MSIMPVHPVADKGKGIEDSKGTGKATNNHVSREGVKKGVRNLEAFYSLNQGSSFNSFLENMSHKKMKMQVSVNVDQGFLMLVAEALI